MEIKIENAKAALKTADESVKKVLLALLPELNETEAQTAANRPITERVKTFEDACRELGEDNHFVEQYRVIEENSDFTSDGHDIFTYLKLRIIAAALNEGWKPQFTEDEERWYPWFMQDVGTKDDSYCPDYINRNRTKETLDDYLKGWIERGLISNDELEQIKNNSIYGNQD